MIEKALKLVQQGFYIFPIHKPSAKYPKGVPCFKDQNNKASNDPARIIAWWTKWPTANIGISPAPLAADKKLFIFDVDSGKHDQAKSSFNKLMALGLPKTLTVKTPSGGYHLFYNHPGGGIIKADDKTWKSEFPGIDLRGDGTFVFAVGSEIGSKSYSWVNESATIENLPLEIVSKLPYKSCDYQSGDKTITDITSEAASFELPAKIHIGERNSVMFAYICSLVAKRKTDKQITTLARKAYKSVEQTDSDAFLWSTVKSMIVRAIAEYGFKPLQEVVNEKPEEVSDESLKSALKHNILIERGSMIADIRDNSGSNLLTFAEWKISKSSLWIDVAEKRMQLPNVWLYHQARRTVFDTAYYPGKQRVFTYQNCDYYNLYSNSRLKPAEGYNYKIVLNHVNFIFNNVEKNIKRFLSWVAFTVRYPDKRIPWVPLIIGKQRTGKGWFYLLLEKLLGEDNCYMVQPAALSDSQINFNEWVGGTLAWFDDVDPKKDFYEAVKSIITEKSLTINQKYGKKEKRKIFCNIIATSNHKNALKLSPDDGRWWIVQSNAVRASQEYYNKLFEWLDSDGPSHFLHYLLNYDLSEFQYAAPPPRTAAKDAMIDSARSEVEQCLRDAAEFGLHGFGQDIVSSDLAVIAVRNSLGTDTDKKLNYQITVALDRLAVCQLPQVRYRINTDAIKKRIKLVCIRKPKWWKTAGSEEVIKEYLTACEESLS